MNRTVSLAVLMVALLALLGCTRKTTSPFGLPKVDLPKITANGIVSKSAPSPIPAPPKITPKAPEQFQVKFRTTKGDFVAEVNRAWSPNGVDRFYNMVKVGYFDDIAIFRAVPNFMFQFGIHGNPAVNDDWGESQIEDDPVVGISNLPGTLCFAKTGQPNSRSTQMFVNLGQNVPLDGQGFTPFGKVVEGMDIVRSINTEYGENPRGEDIQGRFKREGNEFILDRFPRVDLIRSVEIVEPRVVLLSNQ